MTKKQYEHNLSKENDSQHMDAMLTDRGKEYGAYIEMTRVAQSLKTILHKNGNWDFLAPWHQESLDMIMTKVSRILAGNCDNLDSWLDIEGYAKKTRQSIESLP